MATITSPVSSATARAIWWLREAPLRSALATRRPRAMGPSVRLFPAFTSEAEFLDAYWKAMHFIPAGSVSRLIFAVDFKPSFALENPLDYPIPEYVAPVTAGIRRDLEVVRARRGSLSHALRLADVLLVWDWSAVPAGSVAADSPRVRNVDRHRNGSAAWVWADFLFRQWSPVLHAAAIAESRRKLRAYLDGLPRHARAYVFGTGPSLEQAWKFDFSDGYRIACNTIVRNPELLKHIRPHIIVAGDAAYHFDVNRHAAAFRRDLETAMKAHPMRFVTRDLYAPLLSAHHPDLRDRTVLAESGVPGIHFDAPERIVYHQWPHGNILNALLLPLGSALADDIRLLGFDGRAPGERTFWQNAALNTYDEYKPAIEAAQPAFFTGTNFEAYAQSHSENAERIMQAGEAMGKQYRCYNDSYIPAFRKRRAAEATAGK